MGTEIQRVDSLVNSLILRNGEIFALPHAAAGLLSFADRDLSTAGRPENSGPEGAGLIARRDFERSPEDVGIDLHECRVFRGETAGIDDFVNGDSEILGDRLII